jgi:Zn-dependent membrane protease YugP
LSEAKGMVKIMNSRIVVLRTLILVLYILFLLICRGIGRHIKSILNKNAKLQIKSGITGYDFAIAILKRYNISDFKIVKSVGMFSDSFNFFKKELKLFEGTYGGHNISALGVAANEAGHVVQFATHIVTGVTGKILKVFAQFLNIITVILFIVSYFVSRNLRVYFVISSFVAFASVIILQIILYFIEKAAARQAYNAIRQCNVLELGEATLLKEVINALAFKEIIKVSILSDENGIFYGTGGWHRAGGYQ